MTRFAIGLLLVSLWSVTPLAAQQADPGTDVAFWNSVKDTKSPDELKAYLTRFPAGAFADLAKIRLKALETPAAAVAKPATPPAPTAAANPAASAPLTAPSAPASTASTGTVLTSAEVVREVHSRLYNLNYSVGPAANTPTPDLRQAIRSWQANVKRPVTGDIGQADLDYLKRATPSRVWGAIAYAAGGATSAVWSQPTRAIAETAALESCRKSAKGATCKVGTAGEKGCIAVSHYRGRAGNTEYSGTMMAVRQTLAEATVAAQTDCQAQSKVPTTCAIRNSVCADGSHKK